MSTGDATGRTTFVPDARPVRRFVAAIAGMALALGALWWSGAAAARLSPTCRSMATGSESTGPVRLEVHNDGPLSVTILDAASADDHLDITDAEVGDRRVTSHEVDLGGGETVSFLLEVPPAEGTTPPVLSAPTRFVPPRAPVELRVRTSLGVERSMKLSTCIPPW